MRTMTIFVGSSGNDGSWLASRVAAIASTGAQLCVGRPGQQTAWGAAVAPVIAVRDGSGVLRGLVMRCLRLPESKGPASRP